MFSSFNKYVHDVAQQQDQASKSFIWAPWPPGYLGDRAGPWLPAGGPCLGPPDHELCLGPPGPPYQGGPPGGRAHRGSL